MDLIYTDQNRLDIAVLRDFELDFEIGTENNFEIRTSMDNNVVPVGSYFYFEGTEIGGKVTGIRVDTAAEILMYYGKTFYGMLKDKIICPNPGADYYVVSGDANVIIAGLIAKLSLSELFSVSSETSGFTFTNYQFDRYTPCYTGLCKMLGTKNAKLVARFENRRVTLRAVPISDYPHDEFSSDIVNFVVNQNKAPMNHLICLGTGELADRMVTHLYADKNGNISQKQHYTGLDEVTEVYDYPNAESSAELLKGGTERLLELQAVNNIDVTIENAEKDVGDKIYGREIVTNLDVAGVITKKIVKIAGDNLPKFTYEVGNKM